nr:peptidylprolyl isomerase [Bacteroidota bacterium]
MGKDKFYKKQTLSASWAKTAVLACAFLVMPFYTVYAQSDNPVLLTIADENITSTDFLSVYQKNNVNGEVLDKKSLQEYLDLYINFKLKVKEAEELGLDTVPSFINELKGYRDQLAKPYFIDEEVNADLLQEAYDRKSQDIRVSHILIRVDKYATPQDTLKAYLKIMETRDRIVKGEDFNAVAEEVSEDPSARDMPARGFQPPRKGNKGDIGYFSVFDMVYPFEESAYNLPVGEVSPPVKTDFGYHLIKVTKKGPAMGKVQVAHLFMVIPTDATAEDSLVAHNKVDSLYNALMDGSDWNELVLEFSADKGSNMNGGVLPWFGSNRMVPEFIDAVNTISDTGHIAKPVLTSYGWHIIKLVDKKPIGSFEDEKADLKQSLAKDTRSKQSKESIIRRIKKEDNYKDFPMAIEAFYTVIDSTIFKRKWDTEKATGLNETIFELGGETYTQQDFAEYISTHQSISSKESIASYVDKTFAGFVDDKAIEFEDVRLEMKYPEFKSLVNEYRDGILLFELTDQKVWSKAIKDTTGLKEFHKKHKNDYMWGERVDATLVTGSSKAAAENALKLATEGFNGDQIKDAFRNDSTVTVKVITKKFPKNENDIIDNIDWKKGNSKVVKGEDDNWGFAIIHKLVKPEPKSLNESRGLITADYQNFLEKAWIEELKQKYTVTVNEDVLSEIK